MPSSAASRRRHGRGRGKPLSPEPEEHTCGQSDPPPPVAVSKPNHLPRVALPNPNPPNPTIPPSSSSSSSQRRRGAMEATVVDPPKPSHPPEAIASSSSTTTTTSRRRRNRPRRRGRGHARKEEEAEAVVEARDWAGLPLDVVLAVLGKLDHVEILTGAGQVCRSWRRAARDHPVLWHRIDMRGPAELERKVGLLYGMAQAAVRRSAGQCEAFWCEYAADDGLLLFLADRAPSLKSLRLISCCDILNEGFAGAVKKFPLLDELELSLCANIGEDNVFGVVGKACPLLKRFRLSKRCFYDLEDSEYDKDVEALGIATMHKLRSLQLFANILTNEGLTAILDNCTYLESLDIRHCFNITMNDTLRAKCARIKTLKLPHDSTDDYDFQVERPILSNLDSYSDSDDYGSYGGTDYILDSDEYDDYCDPSRYLDGVYEDDLGEEDRMFLKAMRMFMK